MATHDLTLFTGFGDILIPALAAATSLCKTVTMVDLSAGSSSQLAQVPEGVVISGLAGDWKDDTLQDTLMMLRASPARKIFVLCPSMDAFARASTIATGIFSCVSFSRENRAET
jgi:hypothetical protein